MSNFNVDDKVIIDWPEFSEIGRIIKNDSRKQIALVETSTSKTWWGHRDIKYTKSTDFIIKSQSECIFINGIVLIKTDLNIWVAMCSNGKVIFFKEEISLDRIKEIINERVISY